MENEVMTNVEVVEEVAEKSGSFKKFFIGAVCVGALTGLIVYGIKRHREIKAAEEELNEDFEELKVVDDEE